ncbi:MAG: KamA family radical SAM protein [Bacteroidales bacterium]
MNENQKLDKIAITVKSHKLLKELLRENPKLEEIMRHARNETEALIGVRNWVLSYLTERPVAFGFYKGTRKGREAFEELSWQDYAAIRLLDYIDNAGREYEDLNLRGEIAISNPIKLIWLAVNFGTGGAKPYFFEDMLYLFRQFAGTFKRSMPLRENLLEWMERFPGGLDPRIVKLREENRERIINILIEKMDEGKISSTRFSFAPKLSHEQKFLQMLEWWDDYRFHLSFAVRSPELLNELLGNSLDPDTMKILYAAEKAGIPFFVNPYYLSLLHVRVPYFAIGADLAIRYYVVYSQQLVDEFGHIVAWEKEDQVEPGKPNAAGWVLPTHHSVHRRYPEVAILIPATMGRACGGLCASCQRMYDFQRGNLNFNLDKLKPDGSWESQLEKIMEYWEKDAQLRDILITGGDALMSSNQSMEKMLDAVLRMAVRKRKQNETLPPGKKLAEIVRVRLGTRLPAYLPQRITPELIKILKTFREKAIDEGIQQFVIQTHFESPMEITPEVKQAISAFLNSGWIITNQHVFTTAASRRGHNAKLRQVLNEIGILPYYTFSVKGYMENYFNFATNARAVQEQIEEKAFGTLPEKLVDMIRDFSLDPGQMDKSLLQMMQQQNLPFIATDRNVINLPGVGKSLTYRVIGITRYGRRVLQFDHDQTRSHSPIIHKMGKVIIIESKSVSEYIRQLEEIGENAREYESIWGYSIGETEPRVPVYEYPEYAYELTGELTNIELD